MEPRSSGAPATGGSSSTGAWITAGRSRRTEAASGVRPRFRAGARRPRSSADASGCPPDGHVGAPSRATGSTAQRRSSLDRTSITPAAQTAARENGPLRCLDGRGRYALVARDGAEPRRRRAVSLRGVDRRRAARRFRSPGVLRRVSPGAGPPGVSQLAERVRGDDPYRFGADNGYLYIGFDDQNRVVSIRFRTEDSDKFRTPGSPPDRTAVSAGTGAR